jgi:hypothetical protein
MDMDVAMNCEISSGSFAELNCRYRDSSTLILLHS